MSSVNEAFALCSPMVGLLAYRASGGITYVAVGGGIIGALSIGALAYVSADVLNWYLPGGPLTPLVGISIAHGILVPVLLAMIPQTVRPNQLGMAFAVVEVLGSTFALNEIGK